MTQAVREDLREQLEQQRLWEQMSPAQKKKELFRKQKETLGLFLVRHAISQAQYDLSLGLLQEKMGLAE
jgi:hypothetical protein